MYRFVVKNNYSVPGIVSKLVSYFEKNHFEQFPYIITYADRRWSEGGVFLNCGFKFLL